MALMAEKKRGRKPKHPKPDDAPRSTAAISVTLAPDVFAALEAYIETLKYKPVGIRSAVIERFVQDGLGAVGHWPPKDIHAE